MSLHNDNPGAGILCHAWQTIIATDCNHLDDKTETPRQFPGEGRLYPSIWKKLAPTNHVYDVKVRRISFDRFDFESYYLWA
jgi:hypothetical protein